MIYIDAEKFSELVAGRTEKDFCNYAGISKQAFYRLAHYGGPVMIPTITKISNAFGLSALAFLDRRRTSNRDQAQLA